jgi:GNAT superfamily N-acetyltransferase
VRISVVTEADLPELLPLVRGYCDFYEVGPSDEELIALSRALIGDPECEGFQLIACDDDRRALGFATVYWSWSTVAAARLAVMNDLFVQPEGRGRGVAEALIEECRRRGEAHGCALLEWATAADNLRAQAVYDRVGGRREDHWVTYSLPTRTDATPAPA